MNKLAKGRVAMMAGAMICILGLASPPAATGGFNFVTIDVAGAYGTDVYGINDNGLVSGLSFNSSGVSTGFLYNQGSLTSYTAPLPGGGNAVDTEFYQVNNAGQVAVSYYGADGIYHAATYNSVAGTWSYIPDIPGYAGNLAGGINNNGLVVGDAFTTINQSTATYLGGVGWSYNGAYSPLFTAPGSAPANGGTATYSVNDAGQIVGYAIDSSGIYHGYVKTGSSFTTLDFPGAAQFGGTVANGINNAGVVTGYYYNDSSGDFSGFTWQNGVFTTLNFPGALDTAITAINDRGDLAGYYVDANGNLEGFVAYSVPEPGTLTLLGMGLSFVYLWRRGMRRSPPFPGAADA
jgi:PEP-CTERM motif